MFMKRRGEVASDLLAGFLHVYEMDKIDKKTGRSDQPVYGRIFTCLRYVEFWNIWIRIYDRCEKMGKSCVPGCCQIYTCL